MASPRATAVASAAGRGFRMKCATPRQALHKTIPAGQEASMFNVKIKYQSGSSDTGQCATEEEAREAVRAAYLRMLAGQDGITDVIAWEDF
jgi:hypothetical protein